jgi:hypothetical protein
MTRKNAEFITQFQNRFADLVADIEAEFGMKLDLAEMMPNSHNSYRMLVNMRSVDADGAPVFDKVAERNLTKHLGDLFEGPYIGTPIYLNRYESGRYVSGPATIIGYNPMASSKRIRCVDAKGHEYGVDYNDVRAYLAETLKLRA